MGRLDDIIARNQNANRGGRGITRLVLSELDDLAATPEERRRRFLAVGVVLAAIAIGIGSWIGLRGFFSGAPGGVVYDRHGGRVNLSSLWDDRRAIVVFYPSFAC